jgi:hypothetical protein
VLAIITACALVYVPAAGLNVGGTAAGRIVYPADPTGLALYPVP